jgi:DNA-binding transcriptional regulator YdaS (Cro superfamily)
MRHEIRKLGTQRAAAKLWGLSPQNLSHILSGRIEPYKSICEALGFERVVVYQPKNIGIPKRKL